MYCKLSSPKTPVLQVTYPYCFCHTEPGIPGDKVAQWVRCRTSNRRVAGSIPGRGTLVCPWARQFIPYFFSLPSCKMGT